MPLSRSTPPPKLCNDPPHERYGESERGKPENHKGGEPDGANYTDILTLERKETEHSATGAEHECKAQEQKHDGAAK